jgi:hypothetical protein
MPVAQYTEHNTFPTSDALTQAWYDLPSETVYVEVRNSGGIYGYKGFSSEDWREFIEDASSPGRYWGWIKNNFDSVGRFSERPEERKPTQVQEPENVQNKFKVKVHVVADYELSYECDSVIEAHGLATMYLDSKFARFNDKSKKSKIVYRIDSVERQ